MMSFYVYLAVIISGASVLAIELLGTRVIAPFYGASLYLWSALISVTLLALSVGYAVGGRWADRGPKLSRFSVVIGIAGLWIMIIPWLRPPVLALAESAGLRAAVLITATILFFPPLALLGMVSPYAIRLKASNLDEVGRTAGNLYSVSTIASVAAAITTGFFLIPHVGVSRLLLLIGFVLVATAVLGFVVRRRLATMIAMLLVSVAAGALVYSVAPAETADPDNGLVAVEQSAYGEIRVVDLEDTRYMLIDGSMHTGVDPETWQTRFPYVNVLDIAKGFFDRPGKMLLLGLGGGSVARSYQRDGWRVDAVEIDPAVTRVAGEYFGLEPDQATVYEMDARQFLIGHEKKYDLIVMDVFGSSYIPFHLVTAEAFGLLQNHLVPGGILAMNVEAVGWHDMVVRSLAATAHQHFEHVTLLPIAEPPDQLGNLVLMASTRPLDLREEPPVPMDRFSPEYDRAHAWDNRFEENAAGVPVLTDDLNPIDIWAERISLAARKELHATFKAQGIAW